jgi:hypothetical protein
MFWGQENPEQSEKSPTKRVNLHEGPSENSSLPKKKKISWEEIKPTHKSSMNQIPEALCEIESDENTIFFGCRGGKIIQWAIDEQRVARIYSDLTSGDIDVM